MGSFSLAGGGGERNNYTKTMCLARGFCLPPKQLQKILVSEQELVFLVFFFLFEHLLFSGSFSAAGIKMNIFFCFSSGLLFPKLGVLEGQDTGCRRPDRAQPADSDIHLTPSRIEIAEASGCFSEVSSS